MPPFLLPNQLILACHIAGVYDVNRSETLDKDNFALVEAWAKSIEALSLRGIIFHNHFSEKTCIEYQNDAIQFIKVEYEPRFNPNIFRYFVYRDFLCQHTEEIDSLFVTDISDVVVVKNPFIDPFFVTNPDKLFCGDEPKYLENEWMLDHATHLRNKIAGYADYEKQFAASELLNCGIIGGRTHVMLTFIEKLCTLHATYNDDNKTAYTGDMGAFNYLARTQYKDRLIFGAPVNTVFKAYEVERKDCWFRHK